MKARIEYTRTKKKKFYDKNGDLIKVGDKLKLSAQDKLFYKNGIVEEEEGKLGLRFVHQDFFIPLCTLLEEFFDRCEIIKKEKPNEIQKQT